MEKVILATRRFLRDEEGVTAIEYGLIAALIAIVIVATLILVGNNLKNLFNKISNCLGSATIGSSANC